MTERSVSQTAKDRVVMTDVLESEAIPANEDGLVFGYVKDALTGGDIGETPETFRSSKFKREFGHSRCHFACSQQLINQCEKSMMGGKVGKYGELRVQTTAQSAKRLAETEGVD